MIKIVKATVKKKILKTAMVCVFSMMFAACGKAEETIEPTATPTVAVTATAAPTETMAPQETLTPEPTATSTPAPTATSTPAPTATPEPTEAPVAEDSYTKGTITGNTFESEWMGLRFNPPATVIMATQEEMDAVMLQGLQMLYGEEAAEMFDYATMATVNEMQATWLIGMPTVQIIVEKMPMEGVTEADYLAAVKANLESVSGTNGIIYTVDENMYSMELAGQSFYGMATGVDVGNGVIYQDYLVKAKDNRMIVVAFSYTEATEKYLQEALDAFTAY